MLAMKYSQVLASLPGVTVHGFLDLNNGSWREGIQQVIPYRSFIEKI
jgi:hypothetical protein